MPHMSDASESSDSDTSTEEEAFSGAYNAVLRRALMLMDQMSFAIRMSPPKESAISRMAEINEMITEFLMETPPVSARPVSEGAVAPPVCALLQALTGRQTEGITTRTYKSKAGEHAVVATAASWQESWIVTAAGETRLLKRPPPGTHDADRASPKDVARWSRVSKQ